MIVGMACTKTPVQTSNTGGAGGSPDVGGAAGAMNTGGTGGGSVTCPIDQQTLTDTLRQAVLDAQFEQTIDFGPEENGACPKDAGCINKPVEHAPNIDVALIAFSGIPECPPVYANVMLSRDFPTVRVNKIDPDSLAVSDVRWRKWDIDRWNGVKGWLDNPALTDADDVVPGLQGEDFFIPYPASTFKVLVAVEILRLVDQMLVAIDDVHTYNGSAKTLRSWMEEMITFSSNDATSALLTRIHELGKVQDMNDAFASLGLSTLRIDGTKPDGSSWNPGQIHMGAWDTARLLWLIDEDAPTPGWKTPAGTPVSNLFITSSSKQILRGFLRDQGWHEVLSTTALCAIPLTKSGIPALLSDKFIAADGSVTVEGIPMTSDVKPCNAAATMYFDHKTGLTFNYGSATGIAVGIPGKAKRHYILSYFGNLGYRYTDADKLDGGHPCFNSGICFTQRIPAMAAQIDTALAKRLE